MKILLLNGAEYGPALGELGHQIASFDQAHCLDEKKNKQRGYSLEAALDAAGFAPDLVLVQLFGPRMFLRGIEECPYPLAARVYDSSFNHFWLRHYLKLFDYVFVDFKSSLPRLAEEGVEAHWLPYGIDPTCFPPLDVAREYDIGFVGVTKDRPRRQALLESLREEFNIGIAGAIRGEGRLSMAQTAEFYARSRIVINEYLYDGLNFRVFEGMASGSLLLTEASENGLPDLFEEGVHLATFTPETLVERVRYYLEHESARERIAAAGRREVMAHHTRADRARQILDVTGSEPGGLHARDSVERRIHASCAPYAFCRRWPHFEPRMGVVRVLDLAGDRALDCLAGGRYAEQLGTVDRMDAPHADHFAVEATSRGIRRWLATKRRGFEAGSKEGLSMARQTVEWEESASQLVQGVGGDVGTKDRVRRRIEDQARQQGQASVTAAMVRELLEEVSRWGWGGVLAEHEPGSIYGGFLGRKDAEDGARRWRASLGTTLAPVEPTVDFYVEVLGLKPGARVLDLGCGWGRVAIPLARRGFVVTAVESSEDWLAVARASAREERVDVRFIHSDLHVLPWKGLESESDFDAVLSIGVLFQDLPASDTEAQGLLLEVSRLLKPGGHCFVSDFVNRDGILRTATIESDGTAVGHFWGEPAPGSFALVERRFRVDEGRLYVRHVRVDPAGCREYRQVVRVYTLPELIKMLGDAGLVFRQRWSGVNWGAAYRDYTPESRELAILAQKEPL